MPIKTVSVRLEPETAEHLERIAEASGVLPGQVARLLLDQLLPGVERVQPAVRVVKRENGRTPGPVE